MATYKVRNTSGQDFDVDENKIGDAEKDGYLPVVSNGKEEHRVAFSDMPLAAKDGYNPLSEDRHSLWNATKDMASGIKDMAGNAISGAANKIMHPVDTFNDAVDTVKGLGDIGSDAEGLNRAVRSIPVVGQGVEEAEAALSGNRHQFLQELAQKDVQHAQQNPLADFAQRNAAYAAPAALAATGIGAPAAAMAEAAMMNPITQGLDAGLRSLRSGNSMEDAAKDARNAMFLMKAMGMGANAAAEGAQHMAPKLRAFAEDSAVNALNPNAGQAGKIRTRGVNQVGATLLDEGILSPLASKETMFNRLDNARDNVGTQIGDLLKNETGMVDPKSVADNFFDKHLVPASELSGSTEAANRFVKDSALTNLAGKDPMSLSQAQLEKVSLDQKIGNWEKQNLGTTDELSRGLRQELSGQMEDAISPDKQEFYKSLKSKYGDLATSEQIAGRSANKELANNKLPLTSTITGAAAGASALMAGHGLGALAIGGGVALGVKAAKNYGWQSTALGTNYLSKVLAHSPQTFGKFAPVLLSAQSRGETALGVAHYLLSQKDPEYTGLINNLKGDEDESN